MSLEETVVNLEVMIVLGITSDDTKNADNFINNSHGGKVARNVNGFRGGKNFRGGNMSEDRNE